MSPYIGCGIAKSLIIKKQYTNQEIFKKLENR